MRWMRDNPGWARPIVVLVFGLALGCIMQLPVFFAAPLSLFLGIAFVFALATITSYHDD